MTNYSHLDQDHGPPPHKTFPEINFSSPADLDPKGSAQPRHSIGIRIDHNYIVIESPAVKYVITDSPPLPTETRVCDRRE